MKTIAIIVFVLTSINVFGQYSLSGTVRDGESNELLSGASVWIDNSGIPVFTDQNGEFTIKKIKAGTHTVNVLFLGYSKYHSEITITQDTKTEIKLEPTSLIAEGIQVNATRLPEKAPGAVQNISLREIKKENSGLDLPFIIHSSPSAVSTSDAGNGIGYTGLRIRGTDATRINVTVNGIPFNNPESQEVYWVDIPDIASSIDNIQIQRGVGTSTNGASSFGASINIQTQMPGSDPYAELDNSFGSFNSMHNSIKLGSGLINKKWSVDARLSNLQSDGYIDRSASNLQSWFLTGTWLGKNSTIKLNAFSGHEKTHQAWDGIPGEILDTNRTYNVNGMYTDSLGNARFYDNEVDDYRQDNYHILYTFKISEKSWANITMFYTRGEGYYEQYKEDKDINDYKLVSPVNTVDKTDLITQKWMKNDFYGLTWSLNQKSKKHEAIFGGAVNQYDGNHYGKVIWTDKEFISQTFNHEWYENKGIKKDINVFGKFRFTPGKRINLYADLQYRYVNYEIKGTDDDLRDLGQKHEFNFINPKAGFIYDINKYQDVQLALAIANREPNRDNFKDADPGKTPKPERLYNSELSWNFSKNNYNASICVYYMGYKDQLILTGEINNTGSAIMVNVENSYRAGIELIYGIRLLPKLDWKGNLNISRNKISDFINYVDDWEMGGQIAESLGNTDLSFSPEVTANSTLSWNAFKGFVIDWTAKYVGKQYIDNTSSNSRSLDPYLINNLRINYTIKIKSIRELQIKLCLNNLLNEEYETNAWVYRYYYGGFYEMNGYFAQATRNFMIGLVVGI